MGLYDLALQALENYKTKKELPPRFKKDCAFSYRLNDQLQSLADEVQEDIDNLQRQLDEIEAFEEAWDKQPKATQ